MRVAQQLMGRRRNSERNTAPAFNEIDSDTIEEGEHQRVVFILADRCRFGGLEQRILL